MRCRKRVREAPKVTIRTVAVDQLAFTQDSPMAWWELAFGRLRSLGGSARGVSSEFKDGRSMEETKQQIVSGEATRTFPRVLWCWLTLLSSRP